MKRYGVLFGGAKCGGNQNSKRHGVLEIQWNMVFRQGGLG